MSTVSITQDICPKPGHDAGVTHWGDEVGISSSTRDSDPYYQYLPDLHRALAAPGMANGLPLSFVGLNFQQSAAWWETLRYLFRCLLGWKSLPDGLAWWYQEGKATMDDPCLSLARQRWDTRGELDYFAAREWETGGETGFADQVPASPAKGFEPWSGWLRELQTRPALLRHSPYGGGYNALHLGHSDWLGVHTPAGQPSGTCDVATRQAILVVSVFDLWQQELRAFGASLPPLQARSWNVEVFDRKVGFIGRFRQSRLTGEWFLGKHSIHAAGNPVTDTARATP